MKKITKLLLTIICFLALPIIVNADMGAPETYQYEVVVTKKDGTALLDWDNKTIATVPYDTRLTIMYEYTIDGELYGDVEYNDDYGYIKLSDTQLIEGELDYSYFWKNETKERYYTLKETQMYKGPSIVYGKIEDAIIPAGETLVYKYQDEIWSLVEYNGVEGWIYSYPYNDITVYEAIECTVTQVAKKDSKLLVATEDAVLLKEPKEDSEEVGKLTAGEVYEYKYYTYPYVKTTAYYIETDEVSGWLFDYGYNGPGEDKIALYDEVDILTLVDELNVYANYDSEEPVKGITIPKYTELKSAYGLSVKCDEDYETCTIATQVTYNEKEYWIIEQYDYSVDSDYTSEFTSSYSKTKLTFKKDTPIYEEAFYTDTKTDTKIPAGTELVVKFSDYDWGKDETWYFVEYDGVKGWITNKNIEEEIVEEPEENEYPEEDEEKETEEKEEEKESEKEGLTPKQVGLICAGGAVVLALVAIVTIKLINKKKTKKEVKPVEEIVEQPEENKVEETNQEKKTTKKGE